MLLSSARRVVSFAYIAPVFLAALVCAPLHASDQFTKPTPEELAMTSFPGLPGAPAVYLFQEEVTKDDLHVVQHYERIKILTEEGKKYANVELNFATGRGGWLDESDDTMVGDIVGRTIHPDGSIVPFTGKPYLKTIVKGPDVKFQQKVFTLPDVTVGSIIEYRYAKRFSDHFYEAPDWYIQGDLFIKAGHYAWYPTNQPMLDSQQREINSISWFPVLPPGVEIKHTDTFGSRLYEVTVKDVPPKVKEDFMPPIESFSYRVLFNYTSYRTADEFWKNEGKQWSKRVDGFIGSTGNLSKQAAEITAGAATDEDKLKKIYAAVMELENTDFTRERVKQEGKINTVADILAAKRGNALQLTDLFIGLARAAGFKAYAMRVADRSETIFVPMWLSMYQLSDPIAIVNIGGKDQFFDPGERYCPFGKLAWEHTIVRGMRQVDGGTDFAQTPGDVYTSNKTTRVANLTMDEHAELTGKIELAFYGSPALHWRHTALKGDKESTETALEKALEEMVPGSLEVKVTEIKNLTDYEKPLSVTYSAKGTMNTVVGKRLLLPADMFSANEAATFSHEKRELPVYFKYPYSVIDALRINFPKNFAVEATPESSTIKYGTSGIYTRTAESSSTNVTVRRNFVLNEIIVPTKEYGDLRSFYSQFEAKDKDTVILKAAPVQAAENAPARN